MKSRLRIARATILLVLLLAAGTTVTADTGRPALPTIDIVYPKPGQLIGAVDSTFIFGHLTNYDGGWKARVRINGVDVPVHRDGGFLAFLPISPGPFAFDVEAFLSHKNLKERLHDAGRVAGSLTRDDELKLSLIHLVEVPPNRAAARDDTLAIYAEYQPRQGDTYVRTGDVIRLGFYGTPGCRTWASIEGIADSIPLVEIEPQLQPYWGEATFGAGKVPDSAKIRGVYTGRLVVADSMRADSVAVDYFLGPPPIDSLLRVLLTPPFDTSEAHLFRLLVGAFDTEKATAASTSALWMNSGRFPYVVEYTDSVQIVRHGPRRGYQSIFQPEGVRALAVAAEGEWLKLQLSSTQFTWAHQNSVKELPIGTLEPSSFLRSIRTRQNDGATVLTFPLANKHPYRVEEIDRRTIELSMYGVTADTDWIRYDNSDDLVDFASWSQPEEDLYLFRVHLKRDLWGYDAYYKGNTLFLELSHAPERVGSLKGKRIVVDPGHSADPGAIGPTRLTEAEANLAIALRLRRELEGKGADVVMTREDTSHVALYDRPVIARQFDADLFVSVHNNALPDGVNPFANNGSSTFYYHPHSIDLGRAVHRRLVDATELPDHGFYHGNLAVNRPTQYPAILVECAFMMIPEQEAMLKTEKFQKRVARGIARGIEDFLKEYERGNR